MKKSELKKYLGKTVTVTLADETHKKMSTLLL